MNHVEVFNAPLVNSVFHLSDFSQESEKAFAHTLAIALIRKTRLTILHVWGDQDTWTNFPAVRSTLERWGLLKEGSPEAAVFKELGVRTRQVNSVGRDALSAALEYLEQHATDLIVIATPDREALPSWLRSSDAEQIAFESKTMTLFVPHKTRGFVSPEDGTMSLQRILVPVDSSPSPLPAIEYSARAARAFQQPTEIILVHVDQGGKAPNLVLPEIPLCSWEQVSRSGDVVDEIVKLAKERSVDLIMMSTAGRDGFLDALRGSVTQRVLRLSECPLLAVPAV